MKNLHKQNCSLWYMDLYEIEKYKIRCRSPYSKIKVVCCLTTKTKKQVGVNTESASYGLTQCAERNAIFSGVAAGFPLEKVEHIYLYSNLDNISPCGACRQIMSEYLPGEAVLHMDNQNVKVKDLLPQAFTC